MRKLCGEKNGMKEPKQLFNQSETLQTGEVGGGRSQKRRSNAGLYSQISESSCLQLEELLLS